MKRLVIALLVLVAIALNRIEPEGNVGEFAITITTTSRGYSATCETGCAWTELEYNCETAECRSGVDQYGVGGQGRDE